MQFALVDNERTTPSPGLTGFCPACADAMIAKCGTERVHHWAHRAGKACDAWWERETEWHRAWKGRFPDEWQERTFRDRLGERHIADVHTGHGLTIEFQRSHIGPVERAARERFYGNMMWVVDGSRLAGDLPRFLAAMSSFRPIWRKGAYVTPSPDKAFPRSWLNSTVPVLLDFQDSRVVSPAGMNACRALWCLLPVRVLGWAVVLRVARESFVRWAHGKARPIEVMAIAARVERSLRAGQQRQVQVARLPAVRVAMRRHPGRRPFGFRRRFRRF